MVRIHLQKVAATWGYWGQRSEILHGTLYGQYTCHIKIQAQSEKKKLIFGHPNDYIQAYLINFCSLYIYKMDLFILLLLIMFICCLMAEVRVEARGRGITVTGVIMKWWHEVGIDDWYTGPWISGFSLLLLFTLALTVLTKCTWSQLRYFLSIKKISIDC